MSMELRARAFGPPELYYYSTKALRLLHTKLRSRGDRFCSSISIYEKSMHEVRRLTPKMRETDSRTGSVMFHVL